MKYQIINIYEHNVKIILIMVLHENRSYVYTIDKTLRSCASQMLYPPNTWRDRVQHSLALDPHRQREW